ncbi:hypothetical protein HZC07_02845, partial [Candidatus Micrarchaeota archaeon]|nr:hypothetical protein [Candidatus Micrarchaeota archaeon]
DQLPRRAADYSLPPEENPGLSQLLRQLGRLGGLFVTGLLTTNLGKQMENISDCMAQVQAVFLAKIKVAAQNSSELVEDEDTEPNSS